MPIAMEGRYHTLIARSVAQDEQNLGSIRKSSKSFRMTAWGLGCAKTPAVAPHVEISLSNCICGSQIILHKRRSMPCWRIVFSTFRGCMSFYTASVKLDRVDRGDTFIHVRSTPNTDRKFNAPVPVAKCHNQTCSPQQTT